LKPANRKDIINKASDEELKAIIEILINIKNLKLGSKETKAIKKSQKLSRYLKKPDIANLEKTRLFP